MCESTTITFKKSYKIIINLVYHLFILHHGFIKNKTLIKIHGANQLLTIWDSQGQASILLNAKLGKQHRPWYSSATIDVIAIRANFTSIPSENLDVPKLHHGHQKLVLKEKGLRCHCFHKGSCSLIWMEFLIRR